MTTQTPTLRAGDRVRLAARIDAITGSPVPRFGYVMDPRDGKIVEVLWDRNVSPALVLADHLDRVTSDPGDPDFAISAADSRPMTDTDVAVPVTVRVYKDGFKPSAPWHADLVYADGETWKGWQSFWRTRKALLQNVRAVAPHAVIEFT